MSGQRCASVAAAAHRFRNASFSATSAWSRRLRLLSRSAVSGMRRGYSSIAVPSCSIVHEGFAEMGKKGPRDALRRMRKEFRAIHAKGTAALRAGDFDALGEAIDAERKLIDQQKSLLKAHLRLSQTGSLLRRKSAKER